MLNVNTPTKFIFLIKYLILLVMMLVAPLATLEARAAGGEAPPRGEPRDEASRRAAGEIELSGSTFTTVHSGLLLPTLVLTGLTTVTVDGVAQPSTPVCPPTAMAPAASPTSDALTNDIMRIASSLAERVLGTITSSKRTNILLLGSDTRVGDNYGHTDSVIVVTIDPATKSAAMLSIPRDLWVTIPGYGENRINQAYRLGEFKQYPGGGSALVKATVEANFGILIDHYALVKFEGFAQMVDTMGGVEVCVPERLDAASYHGYTATAINKEEYYSFVSASTVLLPESDPAAALDPKRGYEFLYIEAGWHTLNGNTALQYARSRASLTADFARVQRQQAVLMALRSKALQLGLIPKLPELWYTMQAMYETDLTLSDALTLAQLASTIAADHIHTLAISHDQTQGYRTPEGAQVLLPKREAIQALIGASFGVTVPSTSLTHLDAMGEATQPTELVETTTTPNHSAEAEAAVWVR